MNLWILTEERPKKRVLKLIIEKLSSDKNILAKFNKIRILPIIKNGNFTFTYSVTGIEIETIDKIFIKTVSGKGSFVDFLIFLQNEEPIQSSEPLYVIEETKTSDLESRNTGVYQRCSKFVYSDIYYPNCKKIMLYNIKFGEDRKPTDTNIFGTRMLMTLDIEIIGKRLYPMLFKKFQSVDELIRYKNSMRSAPSGNVPILINKFNDRITVSGRLYKSGGLSHDPNIGALTIISKTLRKLGWQKDIVITKHGLSSHHVRRNNKFVKIANEINIKLEGISIPPSKLPEYYWQYSETSEKVTTIFLHLICQELNNVEIIYENHAGCERGYFKTLAGDFITIHKYIENYKSKGIVSLPDIIICDHNRKEIFNIEGKTFYKVQDGISDLENFNPIEEEYIKKYYPGYRIFRFVVLFGGFSSMISRPEVIFLLNSNGKIVFSENTPEIIKQASANFFPKE